VFFQAVYDEIELQNISYDVILVTSSLLRHRKLYQNNVKIFFILPPPSPPIKISGYASAIYD